MVKTLNVEVGPDGEAYIAPQGSGTSFAAEGPRDVDARGDGLERLRVGPSPAGPASGPGIGGSPASGLGAGS